jgi:hypothetical protein
MPRARLLTLLLGSVALAASMAMADTMTVQASGQAVIATAGDSDAARRRALGEALVTAALAGGAELVGYTAMSQASITRDLTVLRATGQVLSHRVIEARQDGQTWLIRVEGEVAPLSERHCAGGRTLALSIEAPAVTTAPQAPAWAGALAGQLAHDLVAVASGHPRVDFDGVIAAGGSVRPVAAALDYTALTRGVARSGPGAHVLRLSLAIAPAQGGAMALGLTADMALTGPDGHVQRRRVETRTNAPRGEGLDLLTGRSRGRAERDLAQGVAQALTALLDQAGCEAPSAILAGGAAGLRVDIGQRHGLSRGSLGFVEGAAPGDGLLEITDLAAGHATLRPLDPTANAAGLVGARVRFVDTGL